MDYSVLEEIMAWCQKGMLWFMITIIFTSRELRDEASRHLYQGVVRIPGVFYGFNVLRGYSAIGQMFPARSHSVRLDYILGYLKMFLLIICAIGLLIIAVKLRS
jgi:hypothetical protein